MKRALRRSKTESIKRKRIRRSFRTQNFDNDSFDTYTKKHKWLALLGSTPKLCSRMCCGNPRRWSNKETRKEKLAKIGHEEQMADRMSDA